MDQSRPTYDIYLRDSYPLGVSSDRIVTRSQTVFNRVAKTETNLSVIADKNNYKVPGQPHLMTYMIGQHGSLPRTVITRDKRPWAMNIDLGIYTNLSGYRPPTTTPTQVFEMEDMRVDEEEEVKEEPIQGVEDMTEEVKTEGTKKKLEAKSSHESHPTTDLPFVYSLRHGRNSLSNELIPTGKIFPKEEFPMEISPAKGQMKTMGITPVGGQMKNMGITPVGGQMKTMGITPVGGQMKDMGITPVGGQMKTMGITPVGGQMKDMGITPVGGKMKTMGITPVGGQMKDMGITPVGGEVKTMGITPVGGKVKTMGITPVQGQMKTMGIAPVEGKVETMGITPVEGKLKTMGITPVQGQLENMDTSPVEEESKDLILHHDDVHHDIHHDVLLTQDVPITKRPSTEDMVIGEDVIIPQDTLMKHSSEEQLIMDVTPNMEETSLIPTKTDKTSNEDLLPNDDKDDQKIFYTLSNSAAKGESILASPRIEPETGIAEVKIPDSKERRRKFSPVL